MFGSKDFIRESLETLRKPSREATEKDMRDFKIVNRLTAALDSGWVDGIGISAVQIGVFLKVGIYVPNRIDPKKPKEPVVLINPIITEFEGVRLKCREGCLSLPRQRVNTYRYEKVTVLNGFKNEVIKASGLEAQVIQHEIDHMHGIVCTDRTKAPGRNEPCPCGSGVKSKRCHWK